MAVWFVSVRFSKGKGLHQYGYTSLHLFGDKLKGRLKHSSPIWHFLRGILIWTIWIKTNDLVFNQKQWPSHKADSRVWVLLMEYARTARTQGPSLWCGVISWIMLCLLGKRIYLELASHLTNKILYCLNLISSGVLDMSCAMERKFYGVCNVPSLGLLDERCLLPEATLGVGQWRVRVNTHLP
jgi:hypothetical protein